PGLQPLANFPCTFREYFTKCARLHEMTQKFWQEALYRECQNIACATKAPLIREVTLTLCSDSSPRSPSAATLQHPSVSRARPYFPVSRVPEPARDYFLGAHVRVRRTYRSLGHHLRQLPGAEPPGGHAPGCFGRTSFACLQVDQEPEGSV